MTETIETYRGVVYPWEIDQVDHMNVQFYTAKFDQATWHFFARLGLTPSYFRTEHRGMAAVQQNTSYKRELHAGDLIVIQSRLEEINQKSIRFVHVMFNSETDEEAARTELTGVHLDKSARKSCAFPEDVLNACRDMLAAES